MDLGRCLAFAIFFSSLAAARSIPEKVGVAAMSSDPPTAYEELESFGFPPGLLPHTVVNYTLNSNGRFSLALNRTCSAMLQGTYLVTYNSQISGTVSPRYIKSLRGVSVRAFFIDWSISGIRVNHQDLVFEVGFASAKFPISNFDEAPECEKESIEVPPSSSSSSRASA
ncbi:uncharacterized protein LOC112343083 [Selaginella moellendorffii]|uniref:uncharacterized protein LOC112343083 n=1 Tax=Selaginella moellendorffii TaxID=88036 RepID=UPI000D1D0B3D|nr:uncharacterized protein LOC112343083 [Selaginella moellendorffii]|eukprot:XP_024521746.1 uncharacterized protein LOC112343083 [Selaginella moellendorffii]